MDGSAAKEFAEVFARTPSVRITAADFEEVYGTMTRAEYPEYTRERALSNVLAQREPPVIVPDGVLRLWLQKYKSPVGIVVPSTAALPTEYGQLVKELAIDHRTPYQLRKALRTTQSPPIIINECMAKQWFKLNSKTMKNQRIFAPNGTLIPHVRGVRSYFGILY